MKINVTPAVLREDSEAVSSRAILVRAIPMLAIYIRIVYVLK